MSVPVLSVDRHEVFRFYKVEHQLQFFFGRVAGNMHLRDFFVDHIRPAPEEVVDDPADRIFIAGYDLCGEDDDIAFLYLDCLCSSMAIRESTLIGSP